MQRYLDRDVTDAESQRLMDHLKQCKDCEEMFERLQQLSFELENLPKVSPPFSIVDSILPDLERLDGTPSLGLSQHEAVSGTVVPMPTRSQRAGGNEVKMKWYKRIPYRTLGGTAAAAILIGLIWTNLNLGLSDSDSNSAESADQMLLLSETTDNASADTGMSEELQDSAAVDSDNNAGNAAALGDPAASGNEISDNMTSDAGTNEGAPEPESAKERNAADDGQGTDGGSQAAEGSPRIGGADGVEKTAEPDKSKETAEPPTDGIVQSVDNRSGLGTDEFGSEPEQGIAAIDKAGDAPVSSTDHGVKGFAPPSTEQAPGTAEPKDTYSVASTGSAGGAVTSPDGAAYAVVMGGQLVIKNSSGDTLFASEQRKDGEKIGALKWSSDSKHLSYEVTGEAGSVAYSVNIETGAQTQVK